MEVAENTDRRDILIGATLGNYVVKHWIGAGGMGVVYLAEQPDIGKAVAIKVLKVDVAANADHLKHLVQEARTVNAIRHRGIIDIFGFGTAPDGRQYIVMEYLEGQPLDAYLASQKRLNPLEALEILDDVLSALGAAHKAGVVHRDLKPGNIFLAQQSDGTRYIKVLDFGLAKKAERPYGSAEQTHYRPAGTPEYMAPEQARGARVGPRTDLYSVGIVAFELLAGEIPFDAPSLVEILIKHVQEPPPSVRDLEPMVPLELDQLVRDLLAKNPADRPQSAEEVRRRIKPIMVALREGATHHGRSPKTAPDLPPPPTPAPADLRELLPLRPNPDTLPSLDPAPAPAPARSGPKAAPAAQRSGPKPVLAPGAADPFEVINTGKTELSSAVEETRPLPAIDSGRLAAVPRAPRTWREGDPRFGLRLTVVLGGAAVLAAITTFILFKVTTAPQNPEPEPPAPRALPPQAEAIPDPVRIEPATETTPAVEEQAEVAPRKEPPVTRPPPAAHHVTRPASTPPPSAAPKDEAPSEAEIRRLVEQARGANPTGQCKALIALALSKLSRPPVAAEERAGLGRGLASCAPPQ